MAEAATILIPDISGYTDFVSKTELDHSAYILNHLLDNIVQTVSDEFVVSEIEGDAVLLYKKGEPPNKKEIIDQCVKTFTSFHNEIRKMSGSTLCQCGACTGLINLSLKFVVHFGSIAEINVSRFTKASGIDMVIAHRLLKNNIPQNEYVLATGSYLNNIPDAGEALNLDWMDSQEEYPSLGVIEFRFASLSPFKEALSPVKNIEGTPTEMDPDQAVQTETEINAPHVEVQEALVDMERRKFFVEGLKDGEGPRMLSMGVRYQCVFDEEKVIIEPKYFEVNPGEIHYEEFSTSPESNYFAVYKFKIKSVGKEQCLFTMSVFPQPGHTFSQELRKSLGERSYKMVKDLKLYCEKYWLENKL